MRGLALVLHSHLPYVRRNGVWPAGEDLFHQVASESYLPLLDALGRLAGRGIRGALTVGITPVLAHQMRDAHMQRELQSYLARIELRALRQVANYRGDDAEAVRSLAAHHALAGRAAAAQLAATGGDLASAFGSLATAGLIELLGGPATHPLVPFITDERLRVAQTLTGAAAHEQIFGARPAGAWIPECAVAPGIDTALAAAGFAYAVVDPAASAVPAQAGDMVLLPRDRALTDLVWSLPGYPSGEWYRDFGRSDTVAGFKNWRVTGTTVEPGDKRPYDPEAARRAAIADAHSFVAAAQRRFDKTGSDTLIVAFDTELFGHWWHEGPVWLETVVSLLASHPSIQPVTLGDVASRHRDAPRAAPAPSSWGAGSDFRNWRSPATEEMFARLSDAEARALRLAGPAGPVRDQMWRELMLLQSSDWTYMVARDENAGYARERFAAHAGRFDALASALESGRDAGDEALSCFEQDNCFAALLAPVDS